MLKRITLDVVVTHVKEEGGENHRIRKKSMVKRQFIANLLITRVRTHTQAHDQMCSNGIVVTSHMCELVCSSRYYVASHCIANGTNNSIADRFDGNENKKKTRRKQNRKRRS